MQFTYRETLFFFFILFPFVSCNNSTNNKTAIKGEFIDTLVEVNKTESLPISDDESSFKLESYNNQEVIATYQSASMYAAATHYYFETEIGEEILVTEGLDETTQVQLPKNMLEQLDIEEGIPEGNPEFIGNMFTLYFNEKGNVYKVIPIN